MTISYNFLHFFNDLGSLYNLEVYLTIFKKPTKSIRILANLLNAARKLPGLADCKTLDFWFDSKISCIICAKNHDLQKLFSHKYFLMIENPLTLDRLSPDVNSATWLENLEREQGRSESTASEFWVFWPFWHKKVRRLEEETKRMSRPRRSFMRPSPPPPYSPCCRQWTVQLKGCSVTGNTIRQKGLT